MIDAADDVAPPLGGRTACLVLARSVNALYFLFTSTYCVLTRERLGCVYDLSAPRP